MRVFIIRFIIFLGIPKIFRFLFQRNKITIVFYHDPKPEAFDKQIRYLKKKFTLINHEQLNEILINKTKKIPPKALLITIDDGHIGNHELLPIIKNQNIRPVIFLTSGLINTSEQFWFKLRFLNKQEKEKLKTLSDKERRNHLIKRLEGCEVNTKKQSLTTNMIKEMMPYVDFQSHSVDHPCLAKCEPEQTEYQLVQSKTTIEEITKKPVTSIAYPDGSFNETVIEIAKQSGYHFGFSAINGTINSNTNPFKLKRISINDTSCFHEFVLRVSAIWRLIQKIK